MPNPLLPDGAFLEYAHDAEEVADSAVSLCVDKESRGFLIGLPEDDDHAPLLDRATALAYVSRHWDLGGVVCLERP